MLAHSLRAFRFAYPSVRISLLTRGLFRPFFEGLDVEIVEFDPKRYIGFRGLITLSREIANMGVEAVADVHGTLRSMTISRLLRLQGVSRQATIDKSRGDKRRALGGGYRSMAAPLRHSVLRYCDVLRSLGFAFDDPTPAKRVQRENPAGEKCGLWVGLAPFSAHEGKCYPLPLCRELVAKLSTKYERVFIHSGGGAEEAFALEMEQAHPNVEAVFPRYRLAAEIDLISNIDCMISMDSLVMHLCSLVATPVVSIWGATHPALGFLGHGVDARGVVQLDMECRPCSVYGSKICRFGDYRCMRDIKVDDILARVELLLV